MELVALLILIVSHLLPLQLHVQPPLLALDLRLDLVHLLDLVRVVQAFAHLAVHHAVLLLELRFEHELLKHADSFYEGLDV